MVSRSPSRRSRRFVASAPRRRRRSGAFMVSDGADNFIKFWIVGFPGLAIFTMAVGANFIGDGMRDLLDPKLRKQF